MKELQEYRRLVSAFQSHVNSLDPKEGDDDLDEELPVPQPCTEEECSSCQ